MVQSLPMSIPDINIEDVGADVTVNPAITVSTTVPATESVAPNGIDTSDSTGFSEIPLTALSKSSRRQLSTLLNGKKILRSEEGYERNWRGIATLAQQKSICDENAISGDDPMSKVLLLWCSNNPKTATFGHLEQYLGIIDRWDVCDDIFENLVEDAKAYKLGQRQRTLSAIDERDNQQPVGNCAVDSDFGNGSDPNILTKDDVLRAQKKLPPQQYDAFVLFADADINYAVEMLTKLEDNAEYSFKLCIKDRDLLAGVSFAHVALTQLIEERCKHLIVILTSEFMKSPENKFLVNYTQALQIQHKTRKIIPLLYEDSVVIPRTLKIYTHLKYNPNSGGLYDFWGKLAASIHNVNISAESPPVYTKNVYSLSATRHANTQKSAQPLKLPAPSATELPSININGHALMPPEEEVPKKKERSKFKKRSSLRNNNSKNNLISETQMLRNAHSTSQLNAGYNLDTNVSMSNLSTTSGCSESKKKRKWPGKLFKKVFSRSTSKLQEPA